MNLMVLRTGDAAPNVSRRFGEFFGLIRQRVGEAWTGTWTEHDLRSAESPPSLKDADGFIISGSDRSVTDNEPWMLRAQDYIRELVAEDVPLLGICFGHQLIAKAIGGEVEPNRYGAEIGTVSINVVQNDPLFQGLPDGFTASAYHHDTVTSLPSQARLLSTTDLDQNSAYAVGKNVRSVQFHPDFEGDVMRGYIDARAGSIRKMGQDPEALSAAVEKHPLGCQVLQNFVRNFVR